MFLLSAPRPCQGFPARGRARTTESVQCVPNENGTRQRRFRMQEVNTHGSA